MNRATFDSLSVALLGGRRQKGGGGVHLHADRPASLDRYGH
jgi:hypothetical protein